MLLFLKKVFIVLKNIKLMIFLVFYDGFDMIILKINKNLKKISFRKYHSSKYITPQILKPSWRVCVTRLIFHHPSRHP